MLVLREGSSRRARRRRIVVALAVVVVLLGAYLGRDTVERWTGVELPDVSEFVESSRSGSSPAAAVSGDSASAREETATAAEPGGTAPPAGLLERRLDSLAAALDRYRERHGDFVQGRLRCQGLSRGFEEVEDRFAAASRAFGRLEAGGGEAGVGEAAGLADRYRRLSSTTDSLDRLFAASDCLEGEEPLE